MEDYRNGNPTFSEIALRVVPGGKPYYTEDDMLKVGELYSNVWFLSSLIELCTLSVEV